MCCTSKLNSPKLNYNDPTINVGKAESPFDVRFLYVTCPYCGQVDVVSVDEKRHKCSACRMPYKVIYDDGNKSESKKQSIPTLFQNGTQSFNNGDGKKFLKNILIVSVIITAIISLVSVFSSNDSEPMPTSTDSSVVVGVKSYLRETLKDPGSYQEIEWSPSGVNNSGQYYIRHSTVQRIRLEDMWWRKRFSFWINHLGSSTLKTINT